MCANDPHNLILNDLNYYEKKLLILSIQTIHKLGQYKTLEKKNHGFQLKNSTDDYVTVTQSSLSLRDKKNDFSIII